MRINLRLRITLFFIGLAIGPLLIAMIMIIQHSFTTEQARALEFQQQVAHRISAEIDSFLNNVQNDVKLLGREMQGVDSAQKMSLILSTLNSGAYREIYREFALLDAEGQEILRLSRTEIALPGDFNNRSGSDEYETAKATNEAYFSPIWFDETTGESLITIAIPLSELRSVSVNNILVVDARMNTIGGLIASIDASEGQAIYVVDAQHRIVAHQNPEVSLEDFTFEIPEQEGIVTGLNGEMAVLAYNTIELGNQILNVVAEKSESEALAGANNTLTAIISIIIGATLAAAILSIIAARYIVSPIERLSRVATEIRGGDFYQKAEMNRTDEIGDLAYAFDAMTDNLQHMIEAERQDKARLETAFAEYVGFVERIARGDLTAQLTLDAQPQQSTSDDLYKLGVNLNMMVDSLRNMTVQVREVASAVARAVAEIQAAATQQHATASEQDAAVTQTMSTVEEVRTTVQQTAERAQQVAESSRQSVSVSRQGQEVVLDTITGMTNVQERVASIAETILALSERTQQIGEIIDTVNALADQSKLLALNASIEAARAGEEGRGFAVVALEVRQLAEQSREATARVQDILGEIQQATNTAVMVTEEGSKGAAAGMSLVDAAGDAIRELATILEDAMQATSQIAASTQQQTNGMEQLASAMTQIQQSSTQAATSAEQTEQSVRNIVDMTQQLENAAARYQL